ncbi:hypothetical protein BGY98DRAFT_1186778 [Russula aff. rugulosa BPL654]|nr:hypothetical protein BGY98DRAFT_1186778 [Russula aff. rugulosa BPL654]
MRHCKIVTWILILSIVNFALGAPAALRGRLEMSVDVDVAKGGTAMSRKWYDPMDDSSTSNAADRPPPRPNLTPSEVEQLWKDVEDQRIGRNSPTTPESPTSTESAGSNSPDYTPSNPGTPTGVTGSHSGPTGGTPPPHLRHPVPSEGGFPSPPGWSLYSDTLSSTGHQPTPPQSLTDGSPLPHPGPSEGRLPSTPRPPVDSDPLSSTGHQPTTPQSLTDGSPLPQPGPSEGRFRPTPPQSPTGGSHLPPLPHPGPSEDRFPSPPGNSDKFLDDLMKGKIKRHIFGSGTVNPARRGTQGQQAFQLDDLPQLNCYY